MLCYVPNECCPEETGIETRLSKDLFPRSILLEKLWHLLAHNDVLPVDDDAARRIFHPRLDCQCCALLHDVGVTACSVSSVPAFDYGYVDLPGHP